MFNYQSPPPFTPSPDVGISAPVPPTAPPPVTPPAPAAAPGMNGIPGAIGMPAAPYPIPMGPPDPSKIKYTTETQQDGTVLLRMMNPNGTPGPVVQIVKVNHGGGGKKK